MFTSLIGRKIRQHQLMTEQGRAIPVTELEVGPCSVVQVKTAEKDGYIAVQLGFGNRTEKSVTKPLKGHLTKTGKATTFPRFLKEVAWVGDEEIVQPGVTVRVEEVFKVGDHVMVTGTSKGKGFAGVVKRHGFAGGPKTHGQSDRERAPGSIGQTTTPGRVYKGKRMAGRMGSDTVTIKGLSVVSINTEKNTLLVKGLIPGGRDSLVTIHQQ